jgi:hypothetical protein
MSKLATFVVAVGALVLAFVTLSPNSAGGGGAGAPASTSMSDPVTAGTVIATARMPIVAIPTAITRTGADVIIAAGIRHARLQGASSIAKGHSRNRAWPFGFSGLFD